MENDVYSLITYTSFFFEQNNKRDPTMPEKNRVFRPGQLYDLQVKIKDLDYTTDMVNISIDSSLSTAYQVVSLTISIDPNDIIVEELFGGDPIYLGITLLRENKYPGPRVDIELMYVSSNFQLTPKSQMSNKLQKDRVLLNIITVARKSYKIMNTLVNKVFIGTTLKQVIEELANDVNAEIKYDTTGQNTDIIKQLCIPPTTLYNIIKEHSRKSDNVFDGYLDQRFGLFNGVAGVFCIDDTVYIKNLSGRMKQAQTFTVYELSGLKDIKELKTITDACVDGKTFYTYASIQTDYSGNAKFAKLSTNLKHIVRPNDTITETITQELKTVAAKYSLQYQKKGLTSKLFIDNASNRTRYYNEDTGFDKSTIIFNSRFGRTIADASTISIMLDRNLPVLNLINVGDCVKFKPTTLEYQDLEGKYILWSSQLNFVNHGNWESTAKVNLIRTNKKN